MPTYEYLCEQCGHRFERFQRISAEPVDVCPSCGGQVRRLIGPGGGILVRGGSARVPARRPGRCGNDSPCCGREQRCDKPPCEGG